MKLTFLWFASAMTWTSLAQGIPDKKLAHFAPPAAAISDVSEIGVILLTGTALFAICSFMRHRVLRKGPVSAHDLNG